MRNVVIVAVALAIAAAIFWFMRRPGEPARAPAPALASGSAVPTSVQTIDTSKVRRLDNATRAQLGAQIAAARARARAATSGSAAGPPDDTMRVEDVSATLRAALRDAGSLVANCYGSELGGHTAAAKMVLTTDPELGTVIDADTITDEEDQPLTEALGTCIRETIESLALPPLADRSGQLSLTYKFRFN